MSLPDGPPCAAAASFTPITVDTHLQEPFIPATILDHRFFGVDFASRDPLRSTRPNLAQEPGRGRSVVSSTLRRHFNRLSINLNIFIDLSYEQVYKQLIIYYCILDDIILFIAVDFFILYIYFYKK